MKATKAKKPRKGSAEANGGSRSLERVVSAPAWLLKQKGITQRQWRQRKRSHIRELRKAFEAFRMGCAYVPSPTGTVGSIEELLNGLEASASCKHWGR